MFIIDKGSRSVADIYVAFKFVITKSSVPSVNIIGRVLSCKSLIGSQPCFNVIRSFIRVSFAYDLVLLSILISPIFKRKSIFI